MTITITTDASFMPSYNIGAYAFWISTPIGKHTDARVFNNPVNSSHDAEFKCIINALYRVKALKLNVEIIYINTDSLICIRSIKNNKATKWCEATLPMYNAIVKQLSAKIVLRHVKAHEHTKTKRNWVNQWCDDNAKRLAKAKVNQIKFGEVNK